MVEAPGQEPVAGAWVFVWTWPPRFTRSDGRGNFALAVPFSGEFELQAVKEGYRRARVPAAEPASQLILGLEPAASIAGRVADAAGRGIGGAGVMVTPPPSRSSLPARPFARNEVVTDGEGRYLLEEVVAGAPLEVDVTVGMRRVPQVAVPPLAAGETKVVDFVLPLAERWSCRIVDEAGNPVAGAEVVAKPVGPGEPRAQPGAAQACGIAFPT